MKYLVPRLAWNHASYKKPCGGHKDGVNDKKGYGAEEWNNLDENIVQIDDNKRRIFYFHSDNLSRKCAEKSTIIFYAHDGRNLILGYALNAEPMLGEVNENRRKRIVKQLDLKRRLNEAWAAPGVQARVKRRKWSRDKFDNDFKKYSDCFASWHCAPQDFVWFDTPFEIDPVSIVNAERFTTRYKSVQEISEEQAIKLFSLINVSPEYAKIARKEVTSTERDTVVKARIAQGQFRTDLMDLWDNRCAVSGMTNKKLLIASHIKPWSKSTHAERVDPNNGILLNRLLDALFDAFLISFDQNGKIIVSELITEDERNEIKFDNLNLWDLKISKKLNSNQIAYLAEHKAELRRRELNPLGES